MKALAILAGKVVLFSTALLSTEVWASASNASREVLVEIPRSRLEATESDSANEALSSNGSLVFGVGSWRPTSIEIRRRDASEASTEWSAPPSISLNYVSRPFLRSDQAGALSWQSGLSLLFLSREVEQVSSRSAPVRDTERVVLIPLRAGLSFESVPGRIGFAAPYLSACALPTAALAPRSAISEGAVLWGFAVELGAGYSAHLSRDAWISQLNVGATWTTGRLQGSRLDGLGVSASASIEL